jgi:large subunit ribosomal protein LP0
LIKAGLLRKFEAPKPEDEDYATRKVNFKAIPALEKLIPVCEGYLGLVFCRDNLSEVKDLLKKYQCTKGAKLNAESPSDVYIQAGPTGLDPKQTAFFQALNIQTKIVKTQIEIINAGKIINKGQKIGASECALLDKLGIRPFKFEVIVSHVYDNGVIYSPSVLDIKKEEIIEKLRLGANYLTAASLSAGYPTTLSTRQSILSGFRNLVAATMGVAYDFNEAKAIKTAVESQPKEEAKAVETKPKVEKKEAEKAEVVPEKKEEKQEEQMTGFGDIFGGD